MVFVICEYQTGQKSRLKKVSGHQPVKLILKTF